MSTALIFSGRVLPTYHDPGPQVHEARATS